MRGEVGRRGIQGREARRRGSSRRGGEVGWQGGGGVREARAFIHLCKVEIFICLF